MAISVYENLSQKVTPKSPCSKSSNLSSCVMKLEYAANESTVSVKNDSTNKISPYLSGDKVQLRSRVTERKVIRKKTDFVSSFPLAVNIYKANSDEFKVSKRDNKKVKKSVLTLPNEPAPVPQMCTVSDMTESEYFNENKDECKPKTRKKRTVKNNRKLVKNKNADIYDRDAKYCSQLNIDLDSSSTDFIDRFPGNNKKKPRRKVKKTDVKAHDVWTMLRNLNQFQFVPSAPMSQESIVSLKKRSNLIKKRNSRRDGRLIETCRTEEFAYISNYVDNSRSQSSLDRVTVIDKQENYQQICQEIEKKIEDCKPKIYRANQKKGKPKFTRKQNLKSIPNNANNTDNKRQVNEAPAKNICNDGGEKNETNELKMYSIDNRDTDQYYDDIDSSRTNLITGSEFNTQQQEQDDYKLRKKIKQQISGITKVVVSKGNNFTQEQTDGERKNLDLITTTYAGRAPKPPESEKPLPNGDENHPQRSKRGRITTRMNVKAVNNGDIKTNKAKANTNTTLHKKQTTNNDLNVLGKDAIDDVGTEMKQKCQLKDKMIKLLYKKHQDDDIVDEGYGEFNKKVKNCLAEFGTNTQIDLDTLDKPNLTKDVIECRQPVLPLKRTWAKGKWASDFIDSVIRKIRSGIYYSNDEKQPSDIKKCQNGKREDSSQTDINHPNSVKAQILDTKEEIFEPYRISFNPPKYEFKSFKRNKIDKNVSLYDEPNHKFRSVREGLNRVNFEHINNIAQVNFTKKREYRNVSKQKEMLKTAPAVKHSWVEGKWASDFIDNIFKKIKNGVYYTHEDCLSKNYSPTKDDSSQTETEISTIVVKQLSNNNNDTIKDDIKTKQTSSCESLPPLPGFDAAPNELQIETYSQNQIAVKNCVTNVVVKFDVELPSDAYQSLQIKQSLSCVPIADPDTNTKVYKSKTTIINAFLPAELCSILPMIMRKIIATNTKFSLPKLTVGKVESSLSSLSTISELTRCESLEFSKRIPCKTCEPRTDLLLNMKSIQLFDCNVKSTAFMDLDHNKLEIDREMWLSLPKKVICMALQIYQPNNKMVPAYRRFNLLTYFENLINTKCLALIMNNLLVINCFKIRCLNESIAIRVELVGGVSPINILISNISTHSTCHNVVNSLEPKENISLSDPQTNIVPKVLDIYTNKSQTDVIEKTKSKSELRSSNIKGKKKGFVKLYRKCKSMSNLSNYKSSINIDKIMNFEEFVKFLGSPKMFSTVIDGNMEEKIMSSLKEMKNWKTDITPRQALLVMLLANKKDTSNVLRYRPIILQGIAVNRITKSSELDMEIEVIERENLNRLSQEYEGYSYLPASVENQDALLEELYWIAKTTASDYQKPFDESSERLLKSLLQKRKKLNPSYLRVMARYVGLGLLKTSK